MISKELMSGVLDEDILQVVTDSGVIESNLKRGLSVFDIAYRVYTTWNYINIHELAHKCKEWALTRGVIVTVSVKAYKPDLSTVIYFAELSTFSVTNKGSIYDKEVFSDNSETEAIFKACQWILDNN